MMSKSIIRVNYKNKVSFYSWTASSSYHQFRWYSLSLLLNFKLWISFTSPPIRTPINHTIKFPWYVKLYVDWILIVLQFKEAVIGVVRNTINVVCTKTNFVFDSTNLKITSDIGVIINSIFGFALRFHIV